MSQKPESPVRSGRLFQTHCYGCSKPFQLSERGKPMIAYAYDSGTKHYEGFCGPCLTKRKEKMGMRLKQLCSLSTERS